MDVLIERSSHGYGKANELDSLGPFAWPTLWRIACKRCRAVLHTIHSAAPGGCVSKISAEQRKPANIFAPIHHASRPASDRSVFGMVRPTRTILPPSNKPHTRTSGILLACSTSQTACSSTLPHLDDSRMSISLLLLPISTLRH